MSNNHWIEQGGFYPTTWVSLGWNPLESVQQAPVYQPDPVRDSLDRTQGREHTVNDPRYPDVKPRLAQRLDVRHSDGHAIWECQSGGFAKPGEGRFRYGNGWTPEEAYAEWKADSAP